MRIVRLLALGIVGAVLPATMFAQNSQLTGPVIGASGNAEIRVPPDHAVVSIGITNKNETARGASSDNGRATGNVIQALRKLGLNPPSVTTSQFAVEQAVRYENNRNPVPDGFSAHDLVSVETDSLGRVPEILDAALAAGATSVSVQFSSSKTNGARAALLVSAYAAARSDAAAIARAAGGSLGALLWASPEGSPIRNLMQLDAVVVTGAAAMSTAPPPPPVILPGNINASVSVSARWAFIPGSSQ
jgi:uncharacterized protein YggE